MYRNLTQIKNLIKILNIDFVSTTTNNDRQTDVKENIESAKFLGFYLFNNYLYKE